MRINKYVLVAFLYMFFDVVFLPKGLTFTMLLTPVFFYWIKKNRGSRVILKFVLFALPFTVVHLWNGVNLYYYFRSTVLYFIIYVICYTFYIFIRDKQEMLGSLFKKILIFNFALVCLAVLAYFTPLYKYFWTLRKLTAGIDTFPRLEMFTYEPSHYSILFAPIAIYYSLKVLLKSYSPERTVMYISMVFIPLILSFSLGILGTLCITLVIFCVINFRQLGMRRHFVYTVFSAVVLISAVILLLFVFFPDNALFHRIENVFAGRDTSGKGRTYGAIKMAWLIAGEKSHLFGAGFGQIKVVGETIIRNYYHYNKADIPVVDIPSATGETLAVFGIAGILLKFGAEILLFIKTGTHYNYFREAAFVFIFIYQFTGSNLLGISEFLLWIIAFTPCCRIFDKPQRPL